MCRKKTDCFAYTGNGCSALKAMYCASEECSFYKNKDVYLEELKKRAQRLIELEEQSAFNNNRR